MAFSVAITYQGTNKVIAAVTATADADTGGNVTHGLSAGGTPKSIFLTQLVSQALTALSAWSTAVPGATTATLTKLTSTGSGNASAQLQVEISTPHTLGA